MPRRRAGWARLAPLWLLPLPILWFAYTLVFNPTDRLVDPSGPCLWHTAFGINGPSCGITRMSWYLLHGNLVEAARMHLVALLTVPLLAYGYVWWVAGRVFGTRLPKPRITKRTVLTYVIVFVAYAVVLRNLPWAPFGWFDIPNLTS